MIYYKGKRPPLKRVTVTIYKLHFAGNFKITFHIKSKVDCTHWRLLRCGYFPHLALRYLLVKLIEKCHNSSSLIFSECKDKNKVSFFQGNSIVFISFWLKRFVIMEKLSYICNRKRLLYVVYLSKSRESD